MEFSTSERVNDLAAQLNRFMDEVIYPAEQKFEQQEADPSLPYPPIMEELKTEARRRGLWNLWFADPTYGPGLTTLEYAPLAEIMGRSLIAPEACNASAPDTGNMEILHMFGSAEQKEQWLLPLLDGKIRSAFVMTERQISSSDAANISMGAVEKGGALILNGDKWWITGVLNPACSVLIVMARTSDDGPSHRRFSQLVVPIDTPGVEIIRPLNAFGYFDAQGHCEVRFTDVSVPRSSLLGELGDGFKIAQARLGPGRIHHCMRSVGAAERALELLCTRALERSTFGYRLAERSNLQDWIAEARLNIEMLRLLTLKTAWLIDTVGAKTAQAEISAIKVAAPTIAGKIIDRAIQVHGAGGLCDDFPLARLFVHQRMLRFADGPDEVHKMVLARTELRRYEPEFRVRTPVS